MPEGLTLGSLFDGIGGWCLAAVRAGIRPIWSSEIEKFPLEVTARHFPDVKQLGDVTKIDGAKIEPVDIICAGSPCQDLSVAGKRAGLAGERSGLFVRAVDIVRQMRVRTNGKYPRFFVWENVPGAFSSNHGRDFQAVLAEIGQTDVPMPQSGRWATAGMVRTQTADIAWRVLDAQYWGVPQRRRRIFLVADFAAEERCAAEVLFVEQSMPRDTAESSTAWKEVASVAGDGAEVSSWCIADNIINRKEKNGGHHLGVDKDVSFTLNTINRHAVFSEGDAHCLQSNYFVIDKQQEVPLYDISHRNDGVREIPRGAANTLVARMGTGGGNVAVLNEADRQETDDVRTVRRLTVTECERLQGLPDEYTDVPLNGKPASDTARYKAIGNGMAQPCADFIMRQIARYGRGKDKG